MNIQSYRPVCTSAALRPPSLSLTRDPIFFLADPSNQSPAFSATHPGHWDKLRGGHELVSFFHSVADCSDLVRYRTILQLLVTRLESIGSAYSGDTTRGCTTSEEALQLWWKVNLVSLPRTPYSWRCDTGQKAGACSVAVKCYSSLSPASLRTAKTDQPQSLHIPLAHNLSFSPRTLFLARQRISCKRPGRPQISRDRWKVYK